jgi:hypothetical protein
MKFSKTGVFYTLQLMAFMRISQEVEKAVTREDGKVDTWIEQIKNEKPKRIVHWYIGIQAETK